MPTPSKSTDNTISVVQRKDIKTVDSMYKNIKSINKTKDSKDSILFIGFNSPEFHNGRRHVLGECSGCIFIYTYLCCDILCTVGGEWPVWYIERGVGSPLDSIDQNEAEPVSEECLCRCRCRCVCERLLVVITHSPHVSKSSQSCVSAGVAMPVSD